MGEVALSDESKTVVVPEVETVTEMMETEELFNIVPKPTIEIVTDSVIETSDIVEGEIISSVIAENLLNDSRSTVVELELPKTLAEFRRLSLQEKAERFPFERITDDKAFHYFIDYLAEIGSSMGFSEAYDEFAEFQNAGIRCRKKNWLSVKLRNPCIYAILWE